MADNARKRDVRSQQGVPEVMEDVDPSKFLTKPVFSDLLREVSEHPDKLEKLRLIVSQSVELTIEELQEELSKVYGRRLTLQETLSIKEMLS
jgi:hypothetical protein